MLRGAGLFLVPAVVAAALGLAATAAAEERSSGTLRAAGQVLLPDGSPAGSATVAATAYSFGRDMMDMAEHEEVIEVDSMGRFEVILPAGDDGAFVYFLGRKEGYASAGVAAFSGVVGDVFAGETPPLDNVMLRLYEEAPVSGRLVHEDGSPAAGYSLKAEQLEHTLDLSGAPSIPLPATSSVKTDEEGGFQLAGLREGPLLITALREKRIAHSWEVSEPDTGLVLTLPRADRVIAGNVYRLDTGFALPEAKVELIRIPGSRAEGMLSAFVGLAQERRAASTVADRAGRFIFDDVRPGRYRFYAEDGTGELRIRNVEMAGLEAVTGGMPVDLLGDSPLLGFVVPEDLTRTHADIHLAPGERLYGKVTDRGTGKPLEGVEVKLHITPLGASFSGPAPDIEEVERTTVTDEEGQFSFYRVHYGSVALLRTHKEGHTFAGASSAGPGLRVLPAQDGQVAILPSPGYERERGLVVEMNPHLTISGVVRRSDGQPIADATVRWFPGRGAQATGLFSGPRWTSVDEEGRFSVTAGAGSTGVIAVRTEHASGLYSGLVWVEDQPVEDVEIVLGEPARASGRVVDSQGEALPGASLTLTPVAPRGAPSLWTEALSTRSGPNGQFKFEDLAAGLYWISVSLEGYASQESDRISLADGEEMAGVEVTLEPATEELRVRVVDAEGKPIEGVMVVVDHPETGPVMQGGLFIPPFTNADGVYAQSGIPRGALELTFFHEDYEFKDVRGVRPEEGMQEFTLHEKTYRALTVFVLDAESGEPAGEFSVSRLDRHWAGEAPELEIKDGSFVDRSIETLDWPIYTIQAEGYADTHVAFRIPSEGHDFERTVELYPGALIIGRVVHRDSGNPIEGVRLELYPGAIEDRYSPMAEKMEGLRPRARTQADGTFRLDDVSGGDFALIVHPPAPHAAVTRAVSHDGRSALELGDIEVGSGGIINVSVTRDGEPAAGLAVTLTGSPISEFIERRSVTDQEGVAVFENLTDGDYSVEAGGTRERVRELTSNETREVLVAIGSGTVSLRLVHRGETYTMGLLDTVSLWSEAGVNRISSRSAGPQGTHRFENLPADIYTVNLMMAKDYDDRTYLNGLSRFELEKGGQHTETIVIPGGEIHATILNAEGEVVEAEARDLTWELLDEWEIGYRRHQPQGATTSFSLEFLPAGEYWIHARHPEYGMAGKRIALGGNEVRDQVELVLEEENTGRLVSTAADREDGKPLPQAWIAMRTEDGLRLAMQGVRRDEDGVAVVDAIPAGTYSVFVGIDDYSWNEQTVTIEAGETTRVEDLLQPGGLLAWQVLDADGEPLLEEPTVRITPLDDGIVAGERTLRSREEGWFYAAGLPPGEYRGRATLPDGKEVVETFEIVLGELTEIRTQLD